MKSVELFAGDQKELVDSPPNPYEPDGGSPCTQAVYRAVILPHQFFHRLGAFILGDLLELYAAYLQEHDGGGSSFSDLVGHPAAWAESQKPMIIILLNGSSLRMR